MRRFRFLIEIANSGFTIGEPFGGEPGTWVISIGADEHGVDTESTISITDDREPTQQVLLHHGLRAQVDISGNDFDDAAEVAELRLHSLLCIASFQNNSSVGIVGLRFGYDITPESASTEFVQVDYLTGALFYDKRKLRIEDTGALLAKVFNSPSPRYVRAVMWYRTALSMDSPYEQFILLWTGLENLNKPLKEKLGGQAETVTCKTCGVEYEKLTSLGIKSLFIAKSPNGEDDFKMCRNLRVDLLHGGGSVADASERINQCRELTRDMLREALYLLLGISDAADDEALYPIYNTSPSRVIYRGHYDAAPRTFSEPPQLLGVIAGVQVQQQGSAQESSIVMNPRPNVPAPVHFKMVVVSDAGQGAGLMLQSSSPVGVSEAHDCRDRLSW